MTKTYKNCSSFLSARWHRCVSFSSLCSWWLWSSDRNPNHWRSHEETRNVVHRDINGFVTWDAGESYRWDRNLCKPRRRASARYNAPIVDIFTQYPISRNSYLMHGLLFCNCKCLRHDAWKINDSWRNNSYVSFFTLSSISYREVKLYRRLILIFAMT